MSVDPLSLKYGDRVIFVDKIEKRVGEVFYSRGKVLFTDRTSLIFEDRLWELAELLDQDLPSGLRLAELNHKNCYVLRHPYCAYRPHQLLGLLKLDVATLEAAGVKEGDE